MRLRKGSRSHIYPDWIGTGNITETASDLREIILPDAESELFSTDLELTYPVLYSAGFDAAGTYTSQPRSKTTVDSRKVVSPHAEPAP